MMNNISVTIKYTNYKGKISDRWIEPIEIFFGETEWHKGYQWFLRADDIDKNVTRDFAIKDILSWRVQYDT